MMRHVAPCLRRSALLALLVVAAACGGAASDAEVDPAKVETVAPSATETRSDLAGVAFDVRRDPG